MSGQAEDRALLVNVAYRLLGSVAEAEDAVQEAYARWYAMPQERRADVASSTAWLVTTVSRICLDVLGSARVRRERYVGEWLPEPVSGSASWTSQAGSPATVDPADRVTLDESLSMAVLLVLETMTPAERVAFVLHDVFGYRYTEISRIVGRAPGACRQLASSARRRVHEGRRQHVRAEEHIRVVSAIKVAWEAGDLAALIELLDPNVIAVADGGGLVSATVDPIRGAEKVARLLLGIRGKQPDLTLRATTVNGRSGLLAVDGLGRTLAVISVLVDDGRIHRIWAMRNPEKLATWT